MKHVREEVLTRHLEWLEEALRAEFPGRERDWAERLAGALAGITQALGQHVTAVEAADGMLAEVDLTRPTFARQVGGLRQEHAKLAEQVRALRAEAEQAAQAFQLGTEPIHDSLPEPPGAASVLDFGALRERGAQLVASLRHHQEEETKLVVDSVTTDIGVGD